MNESQTARRGVPVKIGDSATIFIGPDAITTLRHEAAEQVGNCLREIPKMWDELDPSDPQSVTDLRTKFTQARAAIDALYYLTGAPFGDTDAEGGYSRVSEQQRQGQGGGSRRGF